MAAPLVTNDQCAADAADDSVASAEFVSCRVIGLDANVPR